MRVERKFYETGFADYVLHDADGKAIVGVTVVPPGGRSDAARVVIGYPRRWSLCPEEVGMLTNMLTEAAAYAAAMNEREGVRCE